jgi:hypothetical protein
MLRLGLIRALDGAGRVADTITHYESLINARQFPAGVERWALLNNFADALVRANRNSLDIERAKGLITEAIQVRPDVAALYADDPAAPAFAAIILTHAHLDHYGLAHHVLSLTLIRVSPPAMGDTLPPVEGWRG